MIFPPANFQLAMPFRSQLRVRHGQTDGRRDRQTERQTAVIIAKCPACGRHNNQRLSLSVEQLFWSWRNKWTGSLHL